MKKQSEVAASQHLQFSSTRIPRCNTTPKAVISKPRPNPPPERIAQSGKKVDLKQLRLERAAQRSGDGPGFSRTMKNISDVETMWNTFNKSQRPRDRSNTEVSLDQTRQTAISSLVEQANSLLKIIQSDSDLNQSVSGQPIRRFLHKKRDSLDESKSESTDQLLLLLQSFKPPQ